MGSFYNIIHTKKQFYEKAISFSRYGSVFTRYIAQSAVGSVTLQPKVGLNIACLTDEDNATSRIGFTGGAELGYQATKKFAITGALMYSMQGAKSDFDEYNGTLKLDYINIPILANVYVVKGLALKAGIQPGFCINKKVSVGGISIDIDEAFKQADTNYKINTVDFSIPIGLSYEYNGLVIDARYNLGVTKVADGYIENEGIKMRSDDRHSVFQFTLGYKFQL